MATRLDAQAPGAQRVAHVGDERAVVGVARPRPHVAEAQDPRAPPAAHETGTGSGVTGRGAGTGPGWVPARATAAPAMTQVNGSSNRAA